MNKDDSAAQPGTARGWDPANFPDARLDDLLTQFLDQTSAAETRSPRAALTQRIEQICRHDSGGHPDVMDDTANVPQNVGVYEIVRPLGSGGMGEVYLARHTVLNRNVALKLLRRERAASLKTIERFQREMQALAALSHPHVVSAYDGNIQDSTVYLVMELVDGIDLKQLSQDQPELSRGVCCELIRQAALGLAAIHEAGIVHRDVKPSNIMLTREGTVKILDLGLARLVEQSSELTGPLCVVGTERFMSPEQLKGLPDIDGRTDIYSLGRTLERLLRWDVVPRDGSPNAGRKKDDARLADLIQEMVAEDRDVRLSSATLVAQRLAELCHGIDRSSLTAIAFENSHPRTLQTNAVLTTAARSFFLRWLPVGWWQWFGISVAFVVVAVAIRFQKDRLTSPSSGLEPPPLVSPKPVATTQQTQQDEASGTQYLSSGPGGPAGEVSYARERSFAEWVLSQGGSVTVNMQTSGRWVGKRVARMEDLPETEFLIQVIELLKGVLSEQDRMMLNQLRAIEGLHLYDPQTSDADIFSLHPRWPLKWLYVPGHDVSDLGVEALDSFRNSLLVLDLAQSQITDESIRRLGAYPLLRGLTLTETRISDASVEHLIEFPSLVSLDISGTSVTAAGLRRLSECRQLTKLKLRDLPVNDAILDALSSMPLVELDLRGTLVTADAARRYRESHPDCEIRRD